MLSKLQNRMSVKNEVQLSQKDMVDSNGNLLFW